MHRFELRKRLMRELLQREDASLPPLSDNKRDASCCHPDPALVQYPLHSNTPEGYVACYVLPTRMFCHVGCSVSRDGGPVGSRSFSGQPPPNSRHPAPPTGVTGHPGQHWSCAVAPCVRLAGVWTVVSAGRGRGGGCMLEDGDE